MTVLITSSGSTMGELKVWKKQIGVGTIHITDSGKRYVNDVLNTSRLSYGPYSRRFESKFAKLHDCKHAVFTNSGTSSLQIALAVLKEKYGWNDGDEVLCPATTFIATSNIILQNNMRPVFVDVEPDIYSIDPSQMERHITPRTRCVIVVHLYGHPADMDQILAICRKHHLKLIEDSAETMFARYKGRSVGSFGDIGCFSTYAAHIITTGVGGLTTTNNDEIVIMLRSAMNHGRDSIYLSIDDDKEKDDRQLKMVMRGRFRFIRMGYSYRCTEMEAALGCAELENAKQNLDSRRKNAGALTARLSKHQKYLQLPTIRKDAEHSFMMYPLLIREGASFTCENLTFFLEKHNIETRPMVSILNQPYYHRLFGDDIEERYPVTKWINRNGFYIGCHGDVGRHEIEYICSVFDKFFHERTP